MDGGVRQCEGEKKKHVNCRSMNRTLITHLYKAFLFSFHIHSNPLACHKFNTSVLVWRFVQAVSLLVLCHAPADVSGVKKGQPRVRTLMHEGLITQLGTGQR